MYKIILSLLILAVSSLPGYCNFIVPNQTILGAEEPIPKGEVVILSVSPITKTPEHLVSTTYNWLIIENGKPKKRVAVWADGSQVIFGATGNTEILAFLSINYHYIVKDDNGNIIKAESVTTDIKFVKVVFKGNVPPSPEPSPEPEPEPQPEPTPIPEGKYGLAPKVYTWAKNYVKLSNDDRRKSAKALSNSFASIESAVAAGAIKDIKTLLMEVKKSNNAALDSVGISRNSWDEFGKVLQDYMYELYEADKMITLNDFKTAYSEISLGLKAVD